MIVMAGNAQIFINSRGFCNGLYLHNRLTTESLAEEQLARDMSMSWAKRMLLAQDPRRLLGNDDQGCRPTLSYAQFQMIDVLLWNMSKALTGSVAEEPLSGLPKRSLGVGMIGLPPLIQLLMERILKGDSIVCICR